MTYLLKCYLLNHYIKNSSFSRISAIFSMGPQCHFILRKFKSRYTIQFRFEIVNLYECFLELNKKYAFFSFERNYETFITLLGLLISTRLGSHYFIAWTWYVNFATHFATPRRKHRRPNNIYIYMYKYITDQRDELSRFIHVLLTAN